MDALKAINERVSCRSFKDEYISDELLDQILEAGKSAATGRNLQAPILISIKDPEILASIRHVNQEILKIDTDPFYGAKQIILVIADKNVPTYIYDGSICMANMMVAATALGVGSCWIHRAKEEVESIAGQKLLKQLGIEGNYEGIGNLILGYPKELGKPKPKKKDYIYKV